MEINELANAVVFSLADLVTGKCFRDAFDLSDSVVGRAALKTIAVAIVAGLIAAGILDFGVIVTVSLVVISGLWTFSAAIRVDGMAKMARNAVDRMASTRNEVIHGFDTATSLGNYTKRGILWTSHQADRFGAWFEEQFRPAPRPSKLRVSRYKSELEYKASDKSASNGGSIGRSGSYTNLFMGSDEDE